MAGIPWSKDELSLLKEFSERGLTIREMESNMGRSYSSIRNKLKEHGMTHSNGRKKKWSQPSASAESKAKSIEDESNEMKIAALEAELQEIRTKSHTGTRSKLEDEEESESVEDIWSRCEDDADRRIASAHKRSIFSQEFKKNEPIAISFISDQHIAPGTACDFRKMREDALLIRNTPNLYACLAGDGVDNHIKIRAAMLAARSTADEQWELFDYYLRLFAEKILVVCSGNHDAWTAQMAGTDVLKRVAEANRVRYCPAEARIDLTVGEQEYKIAFRHQYRFNSTFNQTHCVKQWFRMGEAAFDIGVIGHHHEAAIEAFMAHGQVRWAARPGSYQITTPYTTQYGFGKAKPTCPTFIMFPDRKEVIGFWDVRHAVMMLEALRGK
tara:strand:+ start:11425 stop:12576 length:1152 start_codon:yes stop_codon:yes gene_type:complete